MTNDLLFDNLIRDVLSITSGQSNEIRVVK